MHSIHTFVLRVFYDNHQPEPLRGSLQVIGQKDTHPFVGDENLRALLARLIQSETNPDEMETAEQSNPAMDQDSPLS